MTERTVRTDFSSWIFVRVICATSTGSFVTHLTLDVFFFFFFVNVEDHFLQSSWWPDLIQDSTLQRSVFSLFFNWRFFSDVALIDFFVLEVRSCFASLSAPQIRLLTGCQRPCAWSNWMQLPMRRYSGRKTDESVIKNLSSTSGRRCCAYALVENVCELIRSHVRFQICRLDSSHFGPSLLQFHNMTC